MNELVKKIIYRTGQKLIPSVTRKILNHKINTNLTRTKKNTADLRGKPYTLFWSVDAGLSYHFIAHCILARTLKSQNHPALLLRCYRSLARCSVKDCNELPPKSPEHLCNDVCNQCAHYSLKYSKEYNLDTIDIEDFVSAEMTKELNDFVMNYKGNILDFTYDGIGFGKVAAGEVLKTSKLCELEAFDETSLLHTKQHIIGSVFSYIAFKKISESISIQTVVFFGDYSNVQPIMRFMQKNNMHFVNISFASLLDIQKQRIIFYKTFGTKDHFKRLERWDEWKHLPVDQNMIKELGDDVLFKQYGEGTTIYSPKRAENSNHLFNTLKLDKNKKLLVAFTSSLDEILCTNLQYEGLGIEKIEPKSLFSNQIEWLQYLIDFVSESRDLQLVIRIHPREGRDFFKAKKSEHLIKLQENLFESENVRIVWPESNISSYDLAELAQIVLIAWSSLGLEVSRLGVPVIASFQYSPYPVGSFIQIAQTKIDYFNKIKKMLNADANFENITEAFRWLYIFRLAPTVDLRDINPNHDFKTLPKFKVPKEYPKIVDAIINNKNLCEINMEKSAFNDLADEKNAIFIFLRKAFWFLLTGEKKESDYTLICGSGKTVLGCHLDFLESAQHAMAISKESMVHFKTQHYQIEKYSPMASRILKLLTNSSVV